MVCVWQHSLMITNKWRIMKNATTSQFRCLADSKSSRVAIIDGVRTPFCRSGSRYSDVSMYDLARIALTNLANKVGFDKKTVDYVVFGNVLQDSKNINVARDALIGAGYPASTPSHTLGMACISSNRAVCDAYSNIMLGKYSTVIAGGVDSLSDPPIKYSKPIRKFMMKLQKEKLGGLVSIFPLIVELFKTLRFVEAPEIKDFTSGESMGEYCEKMIRVFDVSRSEMDLYALNSQINAENAFKNGKLSDIVPVALPNGKVVDRDDTIRVSSIEKLATLKSSFSNNITDVKVSDAKPFHKYMPVYGNVTPGNSSPLTDGASACLIMDEKVALSRGLIPKAFIVDYLFTASDPIDELLLGPAYSMPMILKKNNLKWSDIDVLEIHEAFAGQVLSVLKAMKTEYFMKEKVKITDNFGEIASSKINPWGGSISLGHPFGATGVRLITMAANRLIDSQGKYALISACAAGGQGHAMIIERNPLYKNKG